MSDNPFNPYIKAIDDTINWIFDVDQTLELLRVERARLEALEKENSEAIKNYNPTRTALEFVENEKNMILVSYVTNAIEETKEFDFEPYRSALIEICRRRDIIKLSVSGNRLNVRYSFNELAGSIDQYANAVTATRKRLRIGPFRNLQKRGDKRSNNMRNLDPALASAMWAEKYYKPAREGSGIEHPSGRQVNVGRYIQAYFDTMQLRFNFLTKPAPFWSLIDKGTRPMKSDWGGTEYPTIIGQDFTGNTGRDLISDYYRIYNENVRYVKEIRDLLPKLREAIKYATERESQLIQLINKQALDWMKRETEEGRYQKKRDKFAEFTRESLEKRLKSKWSSVDDAKLENFITNLLEGAPLPEKVTLGRTPEGVYVRTRAKGLRKVAAMFRGKYG